LAEKLKGIFITMSNKNTTYKIILFISWKQA